VLPRRLAARDRSGRLLPAAGRTVVQDPL